MPHQCVRCNTFYEDGSNELLNGCPCGGKLFFFVKDKKKIQEVTLKLSDEDRLQIEKDVLDIVGVERDEPIVLDLESVNIQKPGKYEIDLVHLFEGDPLVYKMEDGKYMIDIPSSFQMHRKKDEKKE
ncbi:Zn-ribbon domain-containing protein [Candidatus Woesearchaeota archaeon]|nr:Zn-ribbon domain-containing protein [Candidatus Woesearchaeota archaeon]